MGGGEGPAQAPGEPGRELSPGEPGRELSPGDPGGAQAPLVGVLALQGGFEAHERILHGLGARVRQVRVPADLDGLEALVIPGGESTTITQGVEREGLAAPLRELVASGIPVLGTCAGMIVLDRDHLGLLDVRVQRNAFGRQPRSFEAELELELDGANGHPLRAVFIRAPWVQELGEGVEVLAEIDGHPVAVRQDNILAVAFHPELAGETRLHELLLGRVKRQPPLVVRSANRRGPPEAPAAAGPPEAPAAAGPPEAPAAAGPPEAPAAAAQPCSGWRSRS